MSLKIMELSYIWQEGFDCAFLSHIVENEKKHWKSSPATLYASLKAGEPKFLLQLCTAT